MTTPIKLIAIIRTSRPDKSGNTRTVAEYYAPDKGKHRVVTVVCHSPSNAYCLGKQALGGKDWEPLLVTEAAGLPVGVVAAWSKGAMREGSPAAEAALRALLSEEAEVAPPEVKKVTINEEQRLYIIPCGDGYTTWGWDNCAKQVRALALELGVPDTMAAPGSPELYHYWQTLCAQGQKRNAATGWRSASALTPALIGLEGKRVEVVDEWGTTKRFLVGKSTGWMPCHLAIARRGCSGGPAVSIGTPRSVRVVG